MRYYRILYLFLFIIIQTANGQESKKYFASNFTVGLSAGYLWDIDGLKAEGIHNYNEFVWNLSASMRVSKRFWAGIQLNPIFTFESYNGGTFEKKIYQFNGLFTQFDFLYERSFRFYAETSLNVSDYCTCDTVNPYYSPNRKKGLIFWGGGIGIEYILNKNGKKNLLVEVSVFNNIILQKIPYRYNFTQYLVGLNYRFGRLN